MFSPQRLLLREESTMMKMKWSTQFTLFGMVLLSMFVLLACSDDDDNDAITTPSSTTTAISVTTIFSDQDYVLFTSFADIPTTYTRETPVSFTLPTGETHWYEVVYLPEGGVNWVQAAYLAEVSGGYLASITSSEENEFVFSLIADEMYWFQWDETHNYVMNGPFLGGYQTSGSTEPEGGWAWLSGEAWSFSNWCIDGAAEDSDPRNNTQPNDATGDQDIIAYGEINAPVSYWGDFPIRFSTYNSPYEGGSYGFIIEYNSEP